VNSGLMLFADEESALAGVMAHEIAHVCARHSNCNEESNRSGGCYTSDSFRAGRLGRLRNLWRRASCCTAHDAEILSHG
jgi:Peptidase family M48